MSENLSYDIRINQTAWKKAIEVYEERYQHKANSNDDNDSLQSNTNELFVPNSVITIYGTILSTVKEPTTIYIPSNLECIDYVYNKENEKLVLKCNEYVTYVVESGSYAEEYANAMAERYGSKVKVVEKVEYPE